VFVEDRCLTGRHHEVFGDDLTETDHGDDAVTDAELDGRADVFVGDRVAGRPGVSGGLCKRDPPTELRGL
jgi:hypothetical protein